MKNTDLLNRETLAEYVSHPVSGLGRDQAVDFLRGILILGIVLLHFGVLVLYGARGLSASVYLALILNQFFHCGVPGFIFLSGYVNAQRFGGYPSTRVFYLKRFRSLFLPYVLVNLVYVVWAALSPSHIGPHSLKEFFFQFFLEGADWPLYFVPLIAQCYLVLPVFFRFASQSSRFRSLVLVALLAIHVIIGLFCYYNDFSFLFFRHSVFFYPLYWSIYLYFGIFLGLHADLGVVLQKLKVSVVPALLGITVLVYFAVSQVLMPGQRGFSPHVMSLSYFRPPLMAINGAVIVLLAMMLSARHSPSQKYFNWMGRRSYYIFLWHMILLRVLWEIGPLRKLTLDFAPFFLILGMLVTIMAALGVEIWNKVRNGARLRFSNPKTFPA